jgi:hypothetical protein
VLDDGLGRREGILRVRDDNVTRLSSMLHDCCSEWMAGCYSGETSGIPGGNKFGDDCVAEVRSVWPSSEPTNSQTHNSNLPQDSGQEQEMLFPHVGP